jgi:hypothetical protein
LKGDAPLRKRATPLSSPEEPKKVLVSRILATVPPDYANARLVSSKAGSCFAAAKPIYVTAKPI